MNPHRQVLRYYGSKWRIGNWIASFQPAHTCYVSLFGGGANDIFTRTPSFLEIYNDLDGAVVNFFRILRERPDELIRAIAYTPYARAELDLSNEFSPDLDDLEWARRFYVRCNQGRSSGSSVWKTTWRYMVNDLRTKTVCQDFVAIDHLAIAAARLKMVQIENRPALNLIEAYDAPGTLFYADPPYLHSTRNEGWLKAYQHEMSESDHCALALRLRQIQGMAIVSGYASPLYAELYETRGWQRYDIEARTNTNSRRVESIWLNPAIIQRRTRQLHLWNKNGQAT
jgi:DNA adenine methylase